MNAVLDNKEIFSLVIKFFHDLKGNLSPAVIALKDLADGYELSTKEFVVAKDSLLKAITLIKDFEKLVDGLEETLREDGDKEVLLKRFLSDFKNVVCSKAKT